jgi:hypothetical protein
MKYKVTLPVSVIKADFKRKEDNVIGIGVFIADLRILMVKSVIELFESYGIKTNPLKFGKLETSSFLVEDLNPTMIDALRSLNYIVEETGVAIQLPQFVESSVQQPQIADIA